jgi:hypothetical protein
MVSMSSKFLCGLALPGALMASAPGAARAAGSVAGVVALRPSSCMTSQDDDALLRALEVELTSVQLQARDAPETESPAARVVLSADCDRNTGAMTLRIRSSQSSVVQERSIALGEIPEAERPRLLALVIAEALGLELAADEPNAGADARGEASLATRDPYWRAFDSTLYTKEDPYDPSPSLRLGLGTQARLSPRHSNLLFAFELNASGPIASAFQWGVEGSYANADATWTPNGAADVHWWMGAAGLDFVVRDMVDLTLGPRLALGYLTSSTANVARTFDTQLGARAKLATRLSPRTSLEIVLAAQRTIGAFALEREDGVDTTFSGWLYSWGVGLAFQP